MIKIVEADAKQLKQVINSTKWISDTIALDETELIPLDLGGRLMPQTQTINELGKQLLKAAGEGNIEEIRDLMTKGAPFTADWLGTSPLHMAAQNNHLEVCEVLLRAGISRDARTKVDRTPLHMASYEGNIEVVECLLKHGADYDCRDMLCMTPLHWAAQNGHADVASLLIRHGASTNLVNKFKLTASDLASQIGRHDIVDIINVAIRDPLIATQHLQLEMAGDSNDTIEPTIDLTDNDVDNPVPIETILMEEADSENSTDPEKLPEVQNSDSLPEQVVEVGNTSSYLESIKYLQERGITMLPADNSSILNSVIENGHTVVLTEAGKQVLNSIKPSELTPLIAKDNVKVQGRENSVATVNMKKIITVTPEEFLAMTTNCNFSNNVLKQVVSSKPAGTAKTAYMKRIVMKKNKTSPVSATVNVSNFGVKLKKPTPPSELKDMKRQLAEAHKLIEEYKVRLKKKEAEAERYRQQLILVLQTQLQL